MLRALAELPPGIIGQSRSESVNGRLITSDQSIKPRAFRFHRRVSFFDSVLPVAHAAHYRSGGGAFLTSFYGNGRTKFSYKVPAEQDGRVFEYEVDGEGNSRLELWELK